MQEYQKVRLERWAESRGQHRDELRDWSERKREIWLNAQEREKAYLSEIRLVDIFTDAARILQKYAVQGPEIYGTIPTDKRSQAVGLYMIWDYESSETDEEQVSYELISCHPNIERGELNGVVYNQRHKRRDITPATIEDLSKGLVYAYEVPMKISESAEDYWKFLRRLEPIPY